MMETLILGVGNPILTDDSVGFRIASLLKEAKPEVTVIETTEAGLTLLELIEGYDRVIIIDSVKTGHGEPGHLYELTLEQIDPSWNFCSTHGIDITMAFELGHKLGNKLPDKLSIYGIEVDDNKNFGEKCTIEVERNIPQIVDEIIIREKL
ncbi:MAG: hydrogenase maturation protease [Dehalococcoidales bacterium]|nr:hydrogenase maturation protease [Dehalococcoidales bacterium]